MINPCPNCGEPDCTVGGGNGWDNQPGNFYVSCPWVYCNLCGPFGETPEEAADLWNRIVIKPKEKP